MGHESVIFFCVLHQLTRLPPSLNRIYDSVHDIAGDLVFESVILTCQRRVLRSIVDDCTRGELLGLLKSHSLQLEERERLCITRSIL